MSYDVCLKYGDDTAQVERHQEGSIYDMGGITDAWMSITYNYSGVYSRFGFSINDLDGKRAGDTIEKLRELVETLGTVRWRDYWAPTLGNAGYALSVLLKWAQQYPDAVWEVA